MTRALLSAAAFAVALAAPDGSAQPEAIRLNQVGYYPDGPKLAAVVGAPDAPFVVRPADGGEPVFEGELGPSLRWTASGEDARKADFSALTTPGTYVVEVEGMGASYPFEIREAVHEGVARAALKGYYFQRASVPLEAAYAGAWARAAGHPDTSVFVHPSAATQARPAGTALASPGGWYDAGDYGKYVVNSGIAVGTLLGAYEWDPDYLGALDADIPESGDGVPDILDEALVNVRWMLTMQDEDGGVYHKLTTPNFTGEVMPAVAPGTRYVVQKGTAATLDFAAVTAQAARVYADFPDAFPGLADSLRTAALDAWRWARAHPGVAYRQGAMNEAFDPDVHTGEYGDGDFSDEFDWAAMELYVTTGQDSFLVATDALGEVRVGTPSWPNVRELGYHSLMAHREAVSADTAAVRDALVAHAAALADRVERSAFGVTMEDGDFFWGSNSVAANHGVALMVAYRLTGEARYLDAATAVLDYLLGRNGTGFSFLTGHGDRPPLHVHHRPSQADSVGAPVPGLLAGGPNPGQQDSCVYPSDWPAASYSDTWCSYASNEIAINWNAPLVRLAGAVEAARSATGLPTPAGPTAPGSGRNPDAAPNPFR